MSRRKRIIVAALAVAAPAILGLGIYYTWLITPPAMPATADQAIETMGSARFERLPDYRKAEYAAQARRLFAQLPEERRRELRNDETLRKTLGEIRRVGMLERYKRFSQASPEEKIKMLDEDIARQQTARARRPRRPGRDDRTRRGQARRRRDPSGSQRYQRMVQEGNPQGAFGFDAEYRRALKQRKKQLGQPER